MVNHKHFLTVKNQYSVIGNGNKLTKFNLKNCKNLLILNEKFFNKKEYSNILDWISSKFCLNRPRMFYSLLKIHKPKSDWLYPYIIPQRGPVISCINCDVYEISRFLQIKLDPISRLQNSLISDSQHYLSLIKEEKFNQNCLLITLDIKNMFSNINIDSGLLAVKYFLKKYPVEDRPDNFIIGI